MTELDAKVYETYRSSFGHARPNSLDDLLRPRAPFLERLVKRHFPSDRNLEGMDLGCGPGLLVHVARRLGYGRFFGVDTSPEEVGLAKNLGVEGVEHGDLRATLAAMPRESRDLFVALDVLEHFPREAAYELAREVLARLRPGGRWIIHVPNGAGIFGPVVHHSDITHQTLFTPESLAQLLRAAGFAKVESHGLEPIPYGLASAMRLIVWRLVRRLYLAAKLADPGAGGSRIVSSTFLAVATK